MLVWSTGTGNGTCILEYRYRIVENLLWIPILWTTKIAPNRGCTVVKILGQNRQNSSTVAFGSWWFINQNYGTRTRANLLNLLNLVVDRSQYLGTCRYQAISVPCSSTSTVEPKQSTKFSTWRKSLKR